MLDTTATVPGPIISATVIIIVPIIITGIPGVVPGVIRFAGVIPSPVIAPAGIAGSRIAVQLARAVRFLSSTPHQSSGEGE